MPALHAEHPTRAGEAALVVAAVDIAPGMTTDRQFGAATLRMSIEEARVIVNVDIYLDDQKLARETLRPGHTAVRLDLVNGGSRIKGSMAALFAAPGERSTLIADLVAADPSGEHPFRGDLLAWSWAPSASWGERITWITPELSSTAAVQADRNQSVRVRFTGAGQPMTQMTLQIGAQEIVTNRAFRVGWVEIESGARLRMQPATPTQEGAVSLDGKFASSNLPQVRFAGTILTWSYPPPDRAASSSVP